MIFVLFVNCYLMCEAKLLTTDKHKNYLFQIKKFVLDDLVKHMTLKNQTMLLNKIDGLIVERESQIKEDLEKFKYRFNIDLNIDD